MSQLRTTLTSLLLGFAIMLSWDVAPAQAASSSTIQQDITSATLHSSQSDIQARDKLWLAIDLSLKDAWHTYWQNAGDSGLSPSLTWELPEGISTGPIHWPSPERVDLSGIISFGFHNQLAMMIPLTVADDLTPRESFPIKLKAEWLVCKDICIPESAELSLELGYGEHDPSTTPAKFAQWERQLPTLIKTPAEATWQANKLDLKIATSSLIPAGDKLALTSIKSADFFPIEQGIITHNASTNIAINNDDITLSFVPSFSEKTPPDDEAQLKGRLHIITKSGKKHSFIIHAPVRKQAETVAVETPASAEKEPLAEDTNPLTFFTALIFALIGGLILNAMPCVLPVLSLKILALVKKSQSNRQTVIKQGIAYTLGIITCFTIIAGLLIALQHSGQALGWGFQLQQPLFITSLILLLLAIGLNLSGLFHLPDIMGNRGAALSNQNNAAGSYFTGMLAALVATPCTAPFMASAIGFALTLPPLQAMMIFWTLGLGMALPYLAVSLSPALSRMIPKPGAWMDTFRQFLAFPIYATAAWLLWVLTTEAGPLAQAYALAASLMLAMLLWSVSHMQKGSARTIIILIAALSTLYFTLQTRTLTPLDAAATSAQSGEVGSMKNPLAFDNEKIDELRKAKQPLFVYATAAWCITCKLNEFTSLNDNSVHEHFSTNNITVMKADWTRKDDEINRYLESFDRRGVPMYVFYPADGSAPKILSQILTPSGLIEDTTSN